MKQTYRSGREIYCGLFEAKPDFVKRVEEILGGRPMRLGRQNRQTIRRTPHPDPRVEAELQKILMLRRMIDGYEAHIHHYAHVVEDVQQAVDDAMLNHGRNSESLAYITAEQLQQIIRVGECQVSRAEERMSALRSEARHVHEEIAELIAKLSDIDLAFLEPAPL